jgi:hypothetical protein
VTLYRSRRKWILLLLSCLAFTAAGIMMIYQNADKGWFVTIFFGLGAIVSVAMLVPGTGSLKLDGDGFETTDLFVRYRVRWQDASNFGPIQLPRMTSAMVGFDIANPKHPIMAKLSTGLSGHNAALADTYGFASDDLVDLMTQWSALARRPR